MQSRPAFKFWEEYANHLYQPLNALFMLFYKEQFVEIPEFYNLFVDILLEHHEFMLAAECLSRCSNLENIENRELECYLDQMDRKIKTAVLEAKQAKKFPSIINNYEKDTGISESNFQILKDVTLEKYSHDFFSRMYYPYGKRADLSESVEELKNAEQDQFKHFKRNCRLQ